MSDPRVFIGVPTRNRAGHLRESLENILAQDYANLEVLVSDNCSDDDTGEVCRALAARDARLRYVRQPRDLGLHGNHNYCIDAAAGEFLCLFHDHDVRDAGLISAYVNFMRAHPRVGIVCSDWDLIDDRDRQLGMRGWSGAPVTPGLAYITQTIRSGRSSIGTPGALVRRAALGEARFEPDAPIGFGDFPIWFRIAETWDIGHIPTRMWSWRQNAVSHSARPIQDIARDFEQNVSAYCDDHLARWPAHARMVDGWRRSMRRYLFWALTYEVGLHFRPEPDDVPRADRTLFEIMNYRLAPGQIDHNLSQMGRLATGPVEHLARAAVVALVRCGVTAPLGWMIRHQAAVRAVLGLR